jgi:hypothetical protein
VCRENLRHGEQRDAARDEGCADEPSGADPLGQKRGREHDRDDDARLPHRCDRCRSRQVERAEDGSR